MRPKSTLYKLHSAKFNHRLLRTSGRGTTDHAVGQRLDRMVRSLIVTTQKNEGAFLLEWLAHHKSVGFTDILVYSNDCEDGNDTMLDRLQEMGELTHIRNDGSYDDRGIQFTALKHAETHPLVQDADWIISMDVDEFVNIHVGDHTLSALYAALPDADAIAITWRLFGNNGIIEYRDRFITEQFVRAAPKIMYWPWRAFMIKTLYRNTGAYKKLGVHRPRSPDKSQAPHTKWVNGSEDVLPNVFKTKRLFSDYSVDNYQMVQMNHYPLGSMHSFILKTLRGRSGTSYQPLNMDYWCDRNFCTDDDKSILSLNAPTRDRFDAYRADPVLGPLHDAAVAWRAAKLETALADEETRALLGRLMITPPSQPMPARFAHNLRQFSPNTP